MLGLSSIRMSNQNNFPANRSMGCHRRPVGNGRRIIRTRTITIDAHTFGAWPLIIYSWYLYGNVTITSGSDNVGIQIQNVGAIDMVNEN